MKYANLLCLLLVLLLAGPASHARKAKLLEGDLKALKGMKIKRMNVQFVYDGMTISNKQIPEAQYITEKTEERNQKEKGKGDAWAKSWVADRKRFFEPEFKNTFRKYCSITIGEFPEEKYTVIVKTLNTEPGFNVGVMRKNSLVTTEVWIVETADQSHVIAKLLAENCPGSMMGFDFDAGQRIKMSYQVAAAMIGKYVKKKIG